MLITCRIGISLTCSSSSRTRSRLAAICSRISCTHVDSLQLELRGLQAHHCLPEVQERLVLKQHFLQCWRRPLRRHIRRQKLLNPQSSVWYLHSVQSPMVRNSLPSMTVDSRSLIQKIDFLLGAVHKKIRDANPRHFRLPPQTHSSSSTSVHYENLTCYNLTLH